MAPADTLPAWQLLSRLGEAQLLLPLLGLAAGWLAWRGGAPRLAWAWVVATGLAAALTTATKVAFIGYGVGLAALDFTGISGHAMFAAAVLPPLLRLVGAALPARGPALSLALGYGLAAAVALSRVEVGAHSWSEVLAGFALGTLASGLALAGSAPAPQVRLARWMLPLLVVWALAGPLLAPPSRTHDWVTRLALAQSGRPAPYQRWQLHTEQRRAGPL